MASEVNVDPIVARETADGTTETHTGDGWVRTHFDGQILAEVQWLGNQYQIRISRLPERQLLRDVCCRESPALARRQADRLVRDLYPHTCEKADCAPWVVVGNPPPGREPVAKAVGRPAEPAKP